MIKFLLALAGALLIAGTLEGATHLSLQSSNAAAAAPNPNDPVEKEYQKLLDDDDEAQAEVDRWLRDNTEFAAKGGGVSSEELTRRVQERFKPVREAYEEFIKRHPRHARARVAYGSFLGDMHEEGAAQEQLEKALELDKNIPSVYNNLANIYSHVGPVKKAFEFYAKAIELNPKEPVYYHNFGTTVYLFRKDAREHFGIDEQQVFDKAFLLYSNALRLDPTNFPLASDVAQTYYGVKPLRTEDALKAWTNALSLAHDEIEHEGVYLHFARLKLVSGRFTEARAHLNAVTNGMYAELKGRLAGNLERQEAEAKGKGTNAPASPSPSSK